MLHLFLLLALGCPRDDDSPDPSTKTDDTGAVEDTGDPPDGDGGGRMEADLDALAFSDLEPGKVGRRARLIFNSGSEPLALSWEEPEAPFSISGEAGAALPSSLAAQELLRVEVHFAPEEEGSYEDSIVVHSDDPAQPEISIELTGSAVGGQPLSKLTDFDAETPSAFRALALADDGDWVVWQQNDTMEWWRTPTSGEGEPEAMDGPGADWVNWAISADGSVLAHLVDERLYVNGVALDTCETHPEIDDHCLWGSDIQLSSDGSAIYFVSSVAWDCEPLEYTEGRWKWDCDINGGVHDYDKHLWRVDIATSDIEQVATLGDGYIEDLRVDDAGGTFAFVDRTYNRIQTYNTHTGLSTLYDGGLGSCHEPYDLLLSGNGSTVVAASECDDDYELALRVLSTDGSSARVETDYVYSYGLVYLDDISNDGSLFTYEHGGVLKLEDSEGCVLQAAILEEDIHNERSGGMDRFGQTLAFAAPEPEGDAWQLYTVDVTVSSSITVNSTGDEPDEDLDECRCDTGGTTDQGEPACTLRAALETADRMELPSGQQALIDFDLAGAEPATISPSGTLPDIPEQTLVDGSSAEAGRVIIDGSGLSGANSCLYLAGDHSTLKGLEVQSCPGHGVEVEASADYTLLEDIGLINNGEDGLRSGSDITAGGTLRFEGNAGNGAYIDGILFAGTDHLVVRDNGNLGAYVSGGNTQSWLDNVEISGNGGTGLSADQTLFTAGVVRDNGDFGISGDEVFTGTLWVSGNCSDGIAATELTMGENAHVVGNGIGEGCEGDGIYVNGRLLEGEGRLEVTGNSLYGIRIGSLVELSGTMLGEEVLIADNGGIGLYAEMDVEIGEARVLNNGEHGLDVVGTLGAGRLEVTDNAGIGIAATTLFLEEGVVCDNGEAELDVGESTLGDAVEICEE
jgi:CSLREA domain-containing protein